MAKLFNLAHMTTSTVGTGPLVLVSPVEGFLSFTQAGVRDGDTITYAVRDKGHSEIGRGTFQGGTLTRQVIASTNSHRAINLTGSGVVAITPAAEDFLSPDGILEAVETGLDAAAVRIEALEAEVSAIKRDLGDFVSKLRA